MPQTFPEDWAERLVIVEWHAVLGEPPTSASDNFFGAGGTSIDVMRLIARLRETLGVTVSLATILDCPTVAGLAAAVRASAVRP